MDMRNKVVSKLYGVDATIIIFVVVLYCIRWMCWRCIEGILKVYRRCIKDIPKVY